MKDYKLKLRNLLSHTLVGRGTGTQRIETRLIDEKFANTMGEYVTQR